MPAVYKYEPPTSDDRNAFTKDVMKERMTRETAANEAMKYYLGEQDDMLVFDPDEDDVNDNVLINMVKLTADRTATFLFSEVPTVELDPESVDPTEEEKWVVKFIEANGGLGLLNKWALRGFLAGHTFMRVRPKVNKPVRETFPRVSLLDPLSVTIYWNVEDPDEVIWYEVRALAGTQIFIYDYVHNLDEDTWTIYKYASVRREQTTLENVVETTLQQAYSDYKGALDRVTFSDKTWTLEDTEEFPDIGIPPIIETPHLQHPIGRYGAHEGGLKDLQDTINLIASLRNQIARETGTPIDVIVGAGVADVENTEDIWVVDSPNATVQRLQFKGDLTSLNSMLEKLMEVYLALSRVVLLKGEARDLQRVTNASVRTLFLDQIAKNAVLQASYGSSFRMLVKLGLKMSGLGTAGQEFDPVIKWANPLPTDYTELANQLAIIKSIGAVSKRTVSTEMGHNWAFEKVTMEAEAELEMENQRAQMELMQEFAPEPSEGEEEDKPKE
jgi:hypothetical protein